MEIANRMCEKCFGKEVDVNRHIQPQGEDKCIKPSLKKLCEGKTSNAGRSGTRGRQCMESG